MPLFDIKFESLWIFLAIPGDAAAPPPEQFGDLMGGSSLKAESDADESLHPPPPPPTLTESDMEPNPDQLLPPDLPPPEIPFHNNDNDNDEEGSSARCVH